MSPTFVPTSTTSVACGILFGSIFFCAVAGHARVYVSTGRTPFSQSPAPKDKFAKPLAPNQESVLLFLSAASKFGFILAYAYIAENFPPYPHSEKVYDRDLFFMLTGLLFLVSYFTLKANSLVEVCCYLKRKARRRHFCSEGRHYDGQSWFDEVLVRVGTGTKRSWKLSTVVLITSLKSSRPHQGETGLALAAESNELPLGNRGMDKSLSDRCSCRAAPRTLDSSHKTFCTPLEGTSKGPKKLGGGSHGFSLLVI